MTTKNLSPEITSIQWGQVTTNGSTSYKDAKLYPGGSREWDWNETGTHHTPGIQPADVNELLEQGAKQIVLSQGFHDRLQVCEETKRMLKEKNIDFYILNTEEAAQKYNELRTEHPTGALIHSTC